ncbi:uncharacterized protein H6S33_008417 [Morchella sextelata]|uniref:uncharacterized protein n=1 Tax=Morchella sextelata TaxID=1174677 RepID=UPI001D04DB93|nr:uncharacterized protein H6S33_008417 [Morchella sextelata]KAH0602767.1 hypothetical protein H6S33_008417 [Morchella sextelata]
MSTCFCTQETLPFLAAYTIKKRIHATKSRNLIFIFNFFHPEKISFFLRKGRRGPEEKKEKGWIPTMKGRCGRRTCLSHNFEIERSSGGLHMYTHLQGSQICGNHLLSFTFTRRFREGHQAGLGSEILWHDRSPSLAGCDIGAPPIAISSKIRMIELRYVQMPCPVDNVDSDDVLRVRAYDLVCLDHSTENRKYMYMHI